MTSIGEPRRLSTANPKECILRTPSLFTTSIHPSTRWISARHLLGIGAAVVLVTASASVGAQTSGVTIYGTIDLGVTRVSNIAGGSMTRLDDSISQGNRLGFRGREDLGDGLEAFFNLEQGYAADTGALRQGGL